MDSSSMTGKEALWASARHTAEVSLPFILALAIVYTLKDDPEVHAAIVRFVEEAIIPALGGVFALKLNRSWGKTGSHDYVNGIDTKTPGPDGTGA